MERGHKNVMVFGVFDGCHEGHRYFLREAQQYGDELIVVVTHDSIVEQLKGKRPTHSLDERILCVKELGVADVVTAGDKELYSWRVLEKYQPDLVALGHDQDELGGVIHDEGYQTVQLKKWSGSKQ